MKIHVDQYMNVPPGFYCNRCFRIGYAQSDKGKDHPYCETFISYLDRAKNGKFLKHEQCLICCRDSLCDE